MANDDEARTAPTSSPSKVNQSRSGTSLAETLPTSNSSMVLPFSAMSLCQAESVVAVPVAAQVVSIVAGAPLKQWAS